ncbi:prolyl-tRNA synthetase associated domain-containing protein 1 isoform X2 [Nerophis lumbriciformis]|uniref:prolyl-tRNA synthetase associated domain-containing protein 1 isoform X2 n=1 Tax=Nerophis lumbriciformis TaxID=546530 RepID=UPI003BAD9C83
MSEDLRAELQKHLEALNIQTSCVDHPPVYTVEEMMPHLQDVDGVVTKNLFLKDKKKKSLWLVSARHDRQVNLNDLAKKLGVGSGNLRFADEATMLDKLKVRAVPQLWLCSSTRTRASGWSWTRTCWKEDTPWYSSTP